LTWLANVLGAPSSRLDRPVVDRTGLSGPYDIAWVPPAPEAPLPPALEAQLGLTLEPRTEPVDLLVLDHIERPRAAQGEPR
jgi:uncharacterized protein (TIGR03435 family)